MHWLIFVNFHIVMIRNKELEQSYFIQHLTYFILLFFVNFELCGFQNEYDDKNEKFTVVTSAKVSNEYLPKIINDRKEICRGSQMRF